MPTDGWGGGPRETSGGHPAGARGGNRREKKPQNSGSGARNAQQSQGADPHRGQPG